MQEVGCSRWRQGQAGKRGRQISDVGQGARSRRSVAEVSNTLHALAISHLSRTIYDVFFRGVMQAGATAVKCQVSREPRHVAKAVFLSLAGEVHVWVTQYPV